ncbi:MAG: hypothetical protein GC129_02305 [Proteobacteria bacterium]|nr:hypothetical protein [Pseudomonadota bacterium]
MALWRVQVRVQKWLLPAAVALLLAYTADQLLTGERGIVTWRVMKTQLESLHEQNDKLKADIDRLKREIARLKPKPGADGKAADLKDMNVGKLDKDFVDELVRHDLGYIMPGDQVILVNPSHTPRP